MSKSTKNPVYSASLVIAAHLVNEVVDDATGEVKNDMAFVQKDILGGFIWKCDASLRKTGELLSKAEVQLRRDVERFDGTEIARNNLHKSQAWIERLTTQRLTVEELRAQLVAAYEDTVGEAYLSGEDRKRRADKEIANKTAMHPELAAAHAMLESLRAAS